MQSNLTQNDLDMSLRVFFSLICSTAPFTKRVTYWDPDQTASRTIRVGFDSNDHADETKSIFYSASVFYFSLFGVSPSSTPVSAVSLGDKFGISYEAHSLSVPSLAASIGSSTASIGSN